MKYSLKDGWGDSCTSPSPSQMVMTWTENSSSLPWLPKERHTVERVLERGLDTSFWIWSPSGRHPSWWPGEKIILESSSSLLDMLLCTPKLFKMVFWFCQSWHCQTLPPIATYCNEPSSPIAEQITENQGLIQATRRTPALLCSLAFALPSSETATDICCCCSHLDQAAYYWGKMSSLPHSDPLHPK